MQNKCHPQQVWADGDWHRTLSHVGLARICFMWRQILGGGAFFEGFPNWSGTIKLFNLIQNITEFFKFYVIFSHSHNKIITFRKMQSTKFVEKEA